MGLLRRRQGELPSPDALPLIVGGGFVCGDFRSKFEPPPPGDPLRHFWAHPLRENGGQVLTPQLPPGDKGVNDA